MSSHDYDNDGVLGTVREALGHVNMDTPLEHVIAAGRSRQRRRRAGLTTGTVAGAAAALGITLAAIPSAGPPAATGGVPVQTVAYTVDRQSDGSVKVTWNKARYFTDAAGLQAALRAAGFPALIKIGEFCQGPQDDGKLDPSGVGSGVEQVMKGRRTADGRVTFTFTPSTMPPGKQLFIGYLDPAQLAVTHGRPGSVERLVPTNTTLICTTTAPAAGGR